VSERMVKIRLRRSAIGTSPRQRETLRGLGLKRIIFDRNGFLYHGRVRAVAEGAREGGLEL